MENAKRFVLFPISLDPIWQKYKSLEATMWFAEDVLGPLGVKASSVNLPRDAALACLRFIAATQTATPTRVIATVCGAPELACYLGCQEFLTLVHLECAARIVAEGVGNDCDVIEPPTWTTLGDIGTRTDMASRLVYYYAFWSAWTKAFGAWIQGLPMPCSSQFRDMVDRIALDAARFKDFAADACGMFLGHEGLALAANEELMEEAFRRFATDMASALGIEPEVVLRDGIAQEKLDAQKQHLVILETSTEPDEHVFDLTSDF